MLEPVFDVLFNQFYIEIKGASQGPRPADNASFTSPLSLPYLGSIGAKRCFPARDSEPEAPQNYLCCHLFMSKSPRYAAILGSLFSDFVQQ